LFSGASESKSRCAAFRRPDEEFRTSSASASVRPKHARCALNPNNAWTLDTRFKVRRKSMAQAQLEYTKTR
jgi:hypothetical protein